MSNPDSGADAAAASTATTSLLGTDRAPSYTLPAAPGSRRAPKLPAFKLVRDAQKPASDAAPAVIFCSCGGPGSLVQLLPCEHHCLCMACAQKERACPVCGSAISDSRPSFRAVARGAR